MERRALGIERDETRCPECGSEDLRTDYKRAEVVCRNCGLVVDDNFIDMGPEWRAFDHEERNRRTRVGAPLAYGIHDKGLSTTISPTDKDVRGKDIPVDDRVRWHRLRKWQKRIRISSAAEKNLAHALTELDRSSSSLGLPRSVREAASVIYRKAAENRLTKGRNMEEVVAASLYAACRRCNVPRTLKEVAEAARIDKRGIGRTYRALARELGIKLPPTSPADYVPRFASKLGLPGEVQSKALEIIEEAAKAGLISGMNPSGIAAAALYIASLLLDDRRPQKHVAKAAGVTEITLRSKYKELTKQLGIRVRPWI